MRRALHPTILLLLVATMLACAKSQPADADASAAARARAVEELAAQKLALTNDDLVGRCCTVLSDLWAEKGEPYRSAEQACIASRQAQRPSTEVFAAVGKILGPERLPAECK